MPSSEVQERSPRYRSQNRLISLAPGPPGKVVPAPVPVQDRTRDLLRGLVMLLEHHKAKHTIVHSMSEQVSSYLNDASSEKVWCDRVKYLLNFPHARYLKNASPKHPDVVFQPSGLFKRWFVNRISCLNSSNTHLWYSWLQQKRCALPMSDSIVQNSYDDHCTTLTSVDTGNDEVISRILENEAFQLVLDQVKSELETADFTDPTKEFPSTNACFGRSRALGGQLEDLREIVGLSDDGFDDLHLAVRSAELVSMYWVPKSISIGGQVVRSVYECYGRTRWSNLRSYSDPDRPLRCTIQAVLEPMKVRIISKGESHPYYLMKCLQKAMHSSLRKMPCFRLIGRPLCEGDLVDIRGSKDAYWFSVDYSAATDKLSWKYSGAILDRLICDLPLGLQNIARRVIGPHSLYYPTSKDRTVGEMRGTMTRGQLMGSVLSFPLLCLANLGVYLDTVRPLGRSIGHDLRSVLVNGDDMLYCAPSSFWDKHVDTGRAVGLEMSPGKSYFHQTYLNINSISFHWDLTRNSQCRRIDFLNTGLFFGQHKVQNRETAASHHEQSSFAACIDELMKGCFRQKSQILARYLRLHKEDVQRETAAFVRKDGRRYPFSRNLFLAPEYGGLGVAHVEGFRYSITKFQKLVAGSKIFSDIAQGFCLNQGLPLLGWEPQRYEEVPCVPWRGRDVEREVPVYFVQPVMTMSLAKHLLARYRFGFIRSVPCRFYEE